MNSISVVFPVTNGRRAGLALLATALFIGMSMPRASAQLTNGTISGTVQDPQSAAVAGATVTLVSETRGTRLPDVITGTTGDFVVPNVPPDTYTLEVAHPGFKTYRRTGIPVSPGDRVGLGSMIIQVGTLTESVTVTAEAALLQTQSAERSYTIRPSEVQNLPLASRVFTNLVTVTPGVYINSSNLPQRTGDTSSYLSGNTNFMMDGVSTMDTGNNATTMSVNT